MCFNPSGTDNFNKECPKCGLNQDATNKECPQCGYEFPEMVSRRRQQTCPECGLELPITARKCTNCGYIFKRGGRASGGPSGPK
jgi:predicted  nucleic acid-binding Zn-ribbon protein